MKPALLLLTLLLTACAGDHGPTKVRIASLGAGLQTLHLPITLAQSLSYYKEEGLDVTLENLSSNSKTSQALLGGSVDVAGLAHIQTIQLAAEGQHVRTFFVMTQRSGVVLAVAPKASDRIRRVEDLKGAILGVPSPGSPTHLTANYYLLKHGVSPSEMTTVGIGVAASAVAALEAGRVDAAALSSGDHLRLLRRNPSARILVDTGTAEGTREIYGVDNAPIGVLAARREWLDRNPDTARRLARALARALQWIATHTAEELREQLPEQMRSPERDADIQILRWSQTTFSQGGKMPTGGPEAVRHMLEVVNDQVRYQAIDLAATWTNEFLPEPKK